MKLPDRLHCPNCRGRFGNISADSLGCVDCGQTVQVVDGIAAFAADPLTLGPQPVEHYTTLPANGVAAMGLLTRIVAAAGGRWPASLGDTIELGCGLGEMTHAIATTQMVRSLLVLDTRIQNLQTSRERLAPLGSEIGGPIAYATIRGGQDIIRDAVADTVIGARLLSEIGDVRAFLAMVHRVMRPGGRAFFVVANRRYYEAMCLAMAEALVQRRARDGCWPDGQDPILEFIANSRQKLVHRDDPENPSGLGGKYLFDAEDLEDFARELGFATTDLIPLDPDPAGAETIRRICLEAGVSDSFVQSFDLFAAAVGKPFFNLLGRRDSSAAMLLSLTKASGPTVSVFTPQAISPYPNLLPPEAALAGAAPRWSVELLALDTPDGILLTVGGWCLCNSDVRWVRLTLGGVTGVAPVWRPRPDVHDVLNRVRLYNPLNTLCSGMADEILFEGVHAADERCMFRMEVVLASGLIVTGPAPESLKINEPTVISH